ncbi:hypothetical protein NDU88_002477 [Pleurodeles waltl]|uniref:Uncharacterized protein n=1 Tax=Pleurodeles waltl TaxID=8319 RepID=A0AAV7W2H5_PLEWA|nr:hypothetical protein NDU88_002477 [Pleurodeles waltl]
MLRRPQIWGGASASQAPPATLRSPCSTAEGLPTCAGHPISPVFSVVLYRLPWPFPHRSTWSATGPGRTALHHHHHFSLCLSPLSQALVRPGPSTAPKTLLLQSGRGGPSPLWAHTPRRDRCLLWGPNSTTGPGTKARPAAATSLLLRLQFLMLHHIQGQAGA